MSRVQVVENPRKRRRKSRRSLSAAQIAAGFGGRGRMRGRVSRKRRRNPLMASLAANPRRRRRSTRWRYRNPSLGGLNFKGILGTVMAGAFVAGGIFAVRQAPALIAKATGWQPTNIWLQTGVKLAVGIGGGMLLKQFIGQRNAEGFTAGAVGLAVYDLANELFLKNMGLGSYVETPTYVPSLSGYEQGNPPGMFGTSVVPEMAI